MKRLPIFFLLALSLGFSVLTAQTQNKTWVQRLDPALDQLVSPNAKMEVLKDDYFGISEGPVWVKDGQSQFLAFSDIGSNNIYKWTSDGKLSVYLEKTGWTGTDTATLQAYISGFNGRIYTVAFGSNGVALDPQGRLVWTAQGDRAVIRQEKDGKRTVVADKFEGKRLNRPNDLVIKKNGTIYITDGFAANRPGRELDFGGIFMAKDGKVSNVEKEFGTNGITVSPDEKYLYANGMGKIWRYDILTDDTLGNRKMFVDASGDKTPGGLDGMKMDMKGNLYSSGPGGVWVISPEGKHLGTILAPDGGGVTNLAFGDPDGKAIYLTVRRTLAKIRVDAVGYRPNLSN